MVQLAPPAKGHGHQAIERILETLLSDGNPLPPCVLIDDSSETWRRHAALLPVEVRRRSVIAASSEASLIDAVRFEIGGASWLPASTPSMETACETAVTHDRHECAPIATRGVLETLVAETAELWAVGWWPLSFWNRQVGPRRLFAPLTVIAARLGCVPAILPGPVLVVAGRERAAVEEVCRDVSIFEGGAGPCPPAVVNLAVDLRSDATADQVEDLIAVVAQSGREEQRSTDSALPVLEMSTGEKVGWWSMTHETVAGGSGWIAHPSAAEPDGGCWEIVAEDGSQTTVVETTSLRDQERAEQAVIRVPGFIGADVRRGSPAGLLVERWAKDPSREGRPIWVPSVDSDGVRFLLGLPGPIWVDGPGVPR